jgi:DNA-binding GntR family transcriptional regulator
MAMLRARPNLVNTSPSCLLTRVCGSADNPTMVGVTSKVGAASPAVAIPASRRKRTARQVSATGSSETRIFARMHQAVLDRRLQPGMKLKEVELAEAFGVNRAVVRKVLARLSYERLVALRPNRAAVVASPSVQESRDIFAARRVVEAAIVETLARSISRAALKSLRGLVHEEKTAYARSDTQRGLQLSLAFHRELARHAGNGVLAEFLGQLVARTPLVVLSYQASNGDNACADEAHAAIVDALARNDGVEAIAVMRAHLENLEAQLDLAEKKPPTPDLATLLAVAES